MNKKIFIFEPRQLNNVQGSIYQDWKKKPDWRKGESPQLFNVLDINVVAATNPFYFNQLFMRQQTSEIGLSAKNSSGSSACIAQRNEAEKHLLTLIEDFYNEASAGEAVDNISTLLNCFMDPENVGYNPRFACDTVYNTSRVTSFIIKLSEAYEWFLIQNKKEGENG